MGFTEGSQTSVRSINFSTFRRRSWQELQWLWDNTIQKHPFSRETLGVIKSLRRNLAGASLISDIGLSCVHEWFMETSNVPIMTLPTISPSKFSREASDFVRVSLGIQPHQWKVWYLASEMKGDRNSDRSKYLFRPGCHELSEILMEKDYTDSQVTDILVSSYAILWKVHMKQNTNIENTLSDSKSDHSAYWRIILTRILVKIFEPSRTSLTDEGSIRNTKKPLSMIAESAYLKQWRKV